MLCGQTGRNDDSNSRFSQFWVSTEQCGYRGARWLRRYATNWKVAGSIPDGVIGIFH